MTVPPAAEDVAAAAATATHAHDMLVTMATAIAAGVAVIVLARRLGLPSIVLLLVAGVLLGPAVGGDAALAQPAHLGSGLQVIVALAVGLILFEGGLTLDVHGWRSAPSMINRLLTVGVLTTWIATSLAILLVMGLPPEEAVLAASLVIVTGPTVIGPLLRRIQVGPRLHGILHWEGVLIDPIGVFLALLCFEYVISGESGAGALGRLGVRVAAGLGFGAAGGFGITWLVKRRVIPEDMINVGALAGAVLVFGLAELVQSEAGLLAVTVAGFVFGLSGSFRVRQVREFKAELTDLLVGTLFILLTARLTFEQFRSFGWRGVLLVAIVMLVVRPLAVLLCSFRLDLSRAERIFLSWVAPRGIVAASMASLFAISMAGPEGASEDPAGAAAADPRFVETFTYSVIIATIVLQGSSAGWLARRLGLRRPDPTGWLVVGAHVFGRRIARFIAEAAQRPVVLIDTNARAVRAARAEGLTGFVGDAHDPVLRERDEIQAVGNLLALTDNEDLNIRLCQSWAKRLGTEHVFRCNPTGAEPPPEDEAESTPGRLVWARLPRPTLLAGELQRGESTILETSGAPGGTRSATPILATANGRLLFDPGADLPADAPVLALRRTADHLRRSLRPELIARLDVGDVQTLLEALVDRVVGLTPALPRDETVHTLLEQEARFPSALGHGVAVPHTYSEALESRLCAIAQVPDGVDFGAHDGEHVRLVFLLLSPPGDPESHLATLAEIARRVVRPEVRERLIAAASPSEVIGIVRETG